jgi:hypothetical protein
MNRETPNGRWMAKQDAPPPSLENANTSINSMSHRGIFHIGLSTLEPDDQHWRHCFHGMIGTVEIEFCGDPSMILSLIAR